MVVKTQITQDKIRSFLKTNTGILLLIVLQFLERLILAKYWGITFNLGSDDLGYVNSGIHFAQTGMITMWDAYPTAQIMPGMTFLFAALYLIFGEGILLYLAIKLLYFVMAAFTSWYVYKSVTLFAPKWCGLLAVLPFFRIDYVWLNNVPLTETPFLLALSAVVYYSMRLAKERNAKYFYLLLPAFMAGLLIRGNMISFPLFLFGYLLIIKYDRKQLLKFAVILLCVLLVFVIPWSIRNYLRFDTFIPLTYGSGNPTLLGTYQGINYPPDENVEDVRSYNPAYTLTNTVKHIPTEELPTYDILDYKTNVEDVAKEKFKKYYSDNGEVLPQYQNYVSLETDNIKAAYRIKQWAKVDLKTCCIPICLLSPNIC